MSGGVEFQILGPLRVLIHGRPADVGGARVRAVLSALLAEAGQTVSADRLIETLWADVPPASARTQVHVLISQLRKALGGDEVVRTAPGGYRVDPRSARIDAHVAERLIADGRLRRDPGRYERALRLWRGQVLDGWDSPETGRLAELRLTASEEWAELELAAGHPDKVIERLAPLVEEHPYHERLRAQLMIALDRAGTPRKALQLYREGRKRLATDLGIEPGTELRRAERLISGNPVGSTPAQLPGDAARFTGRHTQIENVYGLLAEPGTAVAISGPAGIGKSAFAVHVAHRVADLFPDGQLYVNLHGFTSEMHPVPAVEVLGRFLRAMGVPSTSIPSDEDEAIAAFRSLASGRRLLIVLDNAAGPDQLRPLLPQSPTCGVLITSRRALPGLDGVRRRRLGALEPEEARTLLARFAGAERLAGDPEAVADVLRLCGGLPLALTILGARLVTRPTLSLRTLADRLADERRRLAELSVDDQAVRSSFMISYADLRDDAAAARMFRLLGLLDWPSIGVPVAAAVAGLPERHTAALLDQLLDIHLLERQEPDRYLMHDLLRLFAGERAAEEESGQDRARAVERALHCYVATARRASEVVEPRIAWRIDFVPEELSHPGLPLTSLDQVQAWMDAERENLVSAARQALTSDDPAIGAYLGACLNTPMEQRGRWWDQLALSEVTLEAARHTGDPRHLGLGHNDLGWARHALGQPAEALACFNRALAAWLPIRHYTGVARAMHGKGAALRAQHRYEESLAALRQARAMWAALGHPRHEGACLTGMGLTHQHCGRYAEAIAAHEEGVEVARRTGARVTEIMALGNLGEALRLAGRLEEAAARFREALYLGRERGLEGSYWEAEHQWGLGRTLGDPWCYRRSAQVLRSLGLITEEESREIELSPAPRTPKIIQRQL